MSSCLRPILCTRIPQERVILVPAQEARGGAFVHALVEMVFRCVGVEVHDELLLRKLALRAACDTHPAKLDIIQATLGRLIDVDTVKFHGLDFTWLV